MRERPQRIAPKLKAIREHLGVSQSGMRRINLKCCYTRISEFERGKRQPSLPTLLSYARVAGIPLEQVVDDQIELKF